MEWPKLLRMHWPSVTWLHYASDVDDAVGEIRRVMGAHVADNDELCEAIRWMAGPEGRQEKAPSLRELIRAVYILRKRYRVSLGTDKYASESCAACHRGWAMVRPDPANPDYQAAIPCRCSLGNAKMERCSDYQDMSPARERDVERLRDLAMEQFAERSGTTSFDTGANLNA